jgi:hypothetical protein
MKTKFLPCHEDAPTNSFLCDGYHLTDIQTFEEVMNFYYKVQNTHPTFKLLMTLDDFGQATYTSSHAIENYSLDNTAGHDLSQLGQETFEEGEHKGYLTTPSEFPIRANNFNRLVGEINMNDVYARGLSLYDDELEEIHSAHDDPLFLFDEDMYITMVPVEFSYQSIIAFPNGYFTCDLNPFEIYSLSKYLHDTYHYDLFALGASYVGFYRQCSVDEIDIEQLVEDVSKIYHGDDSQKIKDLFTSVVAQSSFLFLKYTD